MADINASSDLTPERQAALVQFVRKIFGEFTPEILLEDMVSLPALERWNVAFTHKSFSTRNYESIETYGDGRIKAEFLWYLRKSLPRGISPDFMTNAVGYFLSKSYLNALGRKSGVDPLIRVSEFLRSITRDIREDVMEALIGTYSDLGDDYGEARLGDAKGPSLVRSYVAHVFNQIPDLDRELSKSAVADITNRATKFAWGEWSSLKFSATDERRQHFWFIRRDKLPAGAIGLLRPDRIAAMRDLFRRVGRPSPDDYALIGIGTASDAKEAAEVAAADAVKFLDAAGLTTEAANKAKRARDYEITGYKELAEPLEAKFGSFKFQETELSNFTKLHMLVVPLPDGGEWQIASKIIDWNQPYKETQIQLLQLAQVALNAPIPTLLRPTRPTRPVQPMIISGGRGGRGGYRGRGGRGGQGGHRPREQSERD